MALRSQTENLEPSVLAKGPIEREDPRHAPHLEYGERNRIAERPTMPIGPQPSHLLMSW
jgi:hypothetical protein